MNQYKFSSDIQALQQAYHSFSVNVVDPLVQKRADIVQARLYGNAVSELSKMYHVGETTIRSWVRTVDTHGWEGLLDKEKPGRPLKISDWQLSFRDSALQSDPMLYGQYVWDGPTLREFIFHRFGIDYSERQCQRLLGKLGYVLVRSQLFPALGEEDRQDRLDYLQLVQELYDFGLFEVIYEDEVHFYTQPSVTRMWVKKGSAPKVKSLPGKGKVGFFGFVYPENGTLCMIEREKFNSETYIEAIREFLRKVSKPRGQTFAIIHDGASWHKKAIETIYENPFEYADITDHVQFFQLPPYSPDLNPIEQVWRKTRRECTHNRHFANVGQLRFTLETYFERFSHGSAELSSLTSFTNLGKSASA